MAFLVGVICVDLRLIFLPASGLEQLLCNTIHIVRFSGLHLFPLGLFLRLLLISSPFLPGFFITTSRHVFLSRGIFCLFGGCGIYGKNGALLEPWGLLT